MHQYFNPIANIVGSQESYKFKQRTSQDFTRNNHLQSDSSNNSTIKCWLCSEAHKLPSCPKFQSKLLTDKKKVIETYELCCNCLAKEHGIKQCQSKVTCRVDGCRKRHHTLHHETKKVIASQSIADILNSVLRVILSNDSHSVRTNALLDCGADSTVVTEDIAKILQIKGEQKPRKIQNAFLDSDQIESKLVNFTISSTHHPQKIQITKAWSIPNLSISHTTILAIYETNFNVTVKQHTTRKVQFQFLDSFSPVLTKFSFWE